MDEDKKSTSGGFPYSTLVLVIAVLSGVFLNLGMPTLKSPRPNVEPQSSGKTAWDQDIEARMWQDPIAAANRASTRKEGVSHDFVKVPTSLENHCNEFRAQGEEEPQTQILLVMVPSEMYAEQIEIRLRMRHAVVSALSAAGYRPEDEEHIGAWEWSPPKACQESPVLLPFEWFRRRINISPKSSGSNHVLLIWIPDFLFTKKPLGKLSYLVSCIKANETCWKPKDVSIKILGPPDSKMLREMLPWYQDPGPPPAKQGKEDASLDGVQMFSFQATAVDDLLVHGWQRAQPRNAIKEYLKGKCGLDFVNTVATDDQLSVEVLDELKVRGIDLAAPNQHAALIFEWDTFYARTLPLTIAAEVLHRQFAARHKEKSLSECLGQLRKPDNNKPPDSPGAVFYPVRNLHAFTYLRGIDGKVPGQSTSQEASPEPSPSSSKDQGKASQNRAEGQNQLDYIPRLALTMKQLDRELRREGSNLSAIGIVGSDFYDKLLILQALNSYFPDAVFFTTDLDARFLDPQFNQWTRNLIVASSFGLSLDRKLQHDVPPFRGSYQTSLFYATLSSLGTEAPAIVPAPRRFEIGRTRAIDLSVERDKAGVQPEIERRGPEVWQIVALVVASGAGMFLVLRAVPPFFNALSPLQRRLRRQRALRFIEEDIPLPESIGPAILNIRQTHAASPAREAGETEFLPALKKIIEEGSASKVPSCGWAGRLNQLLFDPSWQPRHRGEDDMALLIGPSARNFGIRKWFRFWLSPSTRLSQKKTEEMARRRLQLEEWLNDSVRSCKERCRILNEQLAGTPKGVFVLVVAVIAFSALVIHSHVAPTGEPFSLFEGVSAWPCEILRFIALLLTVIFASKARFDIRANECAISEKFRLPYNPRRRFFRNFGRLLGNYPRKDAWSTPLQFWPRFLWRLRSRYRAVGWNWGWKTEDIPADRLWRDYQDRSRVLPRTLRAIGPALIFVLLGFCIFKLGGVMPLNPIRGTLERGMNIVLLWVTVILFIFLNFFVSDAARLARSFILHLAKGHTCWPKATLRAARSWTGVAETAALDEWLDIRLIGQLTSTVGSLVYYPFIVLAVMIVARMNYWDAWSWPNALIVIFALSSLLPIHSAFLLQSAAKDSRQLALDKLNERLAEARLAKNADADSEKAVERLIQEVKETREGAFTSYLENPALKALIAPFTSATIVSLVSFLTTK